MYVRDVLEIVGAVLWYEQSNGDGFDGCIAPAMVVDTACPVDEINVVAVLGRAPDVEIRELETVLKSVAPWQLELGCNVAISHEHPDGRPHTIMTIVAHDVHEAVLDATVTHQSEDVVADWFEDIGIVVQSPDVLESHEDRLFIQSLGMEATHVTIANRLLLAYSFRHR